MRKSKFKRRKHRVISPWPEDQDSPETVAERVQYVGSPEHKSSLTDAGPPRLRKDASRCPSQIELHEVQEVLREAIRAQCVGDVFQSGFPKYVWGWLDDTLYEGRLVNRGQGDYKGYALDPIEYPKDDQDRLGNLRKEHEV